MSGGQKKESKCRRSPFQPFEGQEQTIKKNERREKRELDHD